MNLSEAVYERMATDALLTSLVASYNGGPAIFTAQPVPDDAQLPFVVSVGQVSGSVDVPETSKQRTGTRIVRDVRIYARADGSYERIEAIAERVWELFERQMLTVTGWQSVRTRADRPVVIDNDGHIYGVVVSVSFAAVKE